MLDKYLLLKMLSSLNKDIIIIIIPQALAMGIL